MSADSESTEPLGGGSGLPLPLELAPVDPDHYADRVELRQGGMGRILTAFDRRLGRRVAIKELRSQGPGLRKRFEAEALITSRLEHPSIVSVHEAGVWPSGEPFYAMKLVAGRPLDEVVDAAAGLDARLALVPHVLAVADALAYAHRLRVIHRDLKPQNVLVGEFGETVVIDWGLVKDLGASAARDGDDLAAPPAAAAGGNATTAGEIMGTPGYMPPEQAEGRAVDERADVYAIGAMLYFVLAAERPYRRERSGLDVLEAVRCGPPEPLRELAPGAPPDLHAIVERAMARDPADRYPTARELAEDLRRFQAGQLVAAHRYSVRQLLVRWLRRHRVAVTVGAIAAAVLLVAGAVALGRIVRSQEEAEVARGTAEAHRADAEDLMQFMLGDLQQRLEPIGKLELLDAVAAKVGAYYQRHPTPSGVEDLYQRALARQHLGFLLSRKGDHAGAVRELRAALELATELQALDPWGVRGLEAMVRSRALTGDALEGRGEMPAALEEYRRAMALAEQLVARSPTPDHERRLANVHNSAGRALGMLDRFDAALVELRTARAILERLVAREPTDRTRRRDLTISNERIGQVLQKQGDMAGALAEHRAGRRIAEQLAAEDPDDTNLQRDLAMGHSRIAGVTEESDPPATLAEYQASLAISTRLASRDPSNMLWQSDVAIAHLLIAQTFITLDRGDAALDEAEAAQRMMAQFVAKEPSNARWKDLLARSLTMRAQARLLRGELDAALADLRSVARMDAAALAEDPGDPSMQMAAAETYSQTASVLRRKRDPAGAAVELRRALALAEPVAARQPKNADWQRQLFVLYAALGEVLLETRDAAGALAAHRSANSAAAQLAAMSPTRDHRRNLGSTHELVGNALLAGGDAAGAAAEYRKGLTIAQELAAQETLPDGWRPDIAEFHVDLAKAAAALGDRAGAAAEYREARALFEKLAAEAPGVEKERVEAGLAAARAKLGR